MSSWWLSNVDEMVSAAFAEKGPPPSKEEVHWRVLSIVGFAIIRGGLSSVGNSSRADAVVRVAANHDGAVPGCFGGGAIVGVMADDDDAVLGRPGGGAAVRVVADDDGAVSGRLGGGAIVRVAADHDGAVPRRPGGGTTVTDVVLNIADDGTLEDPMKL